MTNSIEPIKIVCTDDEDSILRLVRAYISVCAQKPNTRVYGGHSKSELVDLVREHNPKIIITDKDMEREDIALEGIRKIREILKYETPVILMSGNMNGAEEKLKDLKDISYLIKPFNLSSFKETMKAAYPDYF